MEEAKLNDSCPLNDFFRVMRVEVNGWDYWFQIFPGAAFVAVQGTRNFSNGQIPAHGFLLEYSQLENSQTDEGFPGQHQL